MKAKIFFLCLTLLQTSYILNSSGGGGSKTDTQDDFLIQFVQKIRDLRELEGEKKTEFEKSKTTTRLGRMVQAIEDGKSLTEIPQTEISETINTKFYHPEWRYDITLLQLAIKKGAVESVKALIAAGAKVKNHHMLEAVKNNHLEVAKVIYKANNDTIKATINVEGIEIPLSGKAALLDSRKLFDWLLPLEQTTHPDLDFFSEEYSPLVEIAGACPLYYLEKITAHYAPTGLDDCNLDSVINAAFYNGLDRTDVIQHLLGLKADPNAYDEGIDMTLLQRAYSAGNGEVVQMLLDAKADPAFNEPLATTALAAAAAEEDDAPVRKQLRIEDQ